jgi:hypothetical protein
MFRVSVICRVVSESASDFDLRLRELDRLDEERPLQAVEDCNGTTSSPLSVLAIFAAAELLRLPGQL